ncbi:cytochrome c oxidase assembly protein subunit 15 [Paenibacillus phyllosphaerae]|uniref:Cytochrome c oxidase assembly protein subunit 15 n=1 Tax=Paenibacillus phyllosphaerae TaxID=274593 RepID=A0A7W5FKS8_9BACL|nr:COX15/CtaA family protein [Paenibacillus phyllosphaerae]MBB3108431.1 cytochrome c oxidase assembly protein subunit 15 [Paenibacillus phyllosphaerae]
MISRRYRVLVLAACIGMLLVLLAGALVTNTESGRGCGDDWPLCNGKFVPAYTVESLIEYSHRLVTGVVGLIVLAVFALTLKDYRQYKEAVWYSAGTGFFTILQALLGAAAVIWPTSPPVMALHFGFSIMAFTCTMLHVMWVRRMQRGYDESKPARAVHPAVFSLTMGALAFSYVVIYLGAFIRHTDSAGGCIGWPLCNGAVIPEMEGATSIVFAHRVGAIILASLIGWLYFKASKVASDMPGIRRSARASFVLVICQIFSGALLTATLTNEDWFLFTSLLHNVIVSFLFGVMTDLAIRSWRWREGRYRG